MICELMPANGSQRANGSGCCGSWLQVHNPKVIIEHNTLQLVTYIVIAMVVLKIVFWSINVDKF